MHKPNVIYVASSFSERSGLKFYFTQLAIALQKKLNNLIVVSANTEQEKGLFKKLKQENIKIYTNPCLDKISIINTIDGIIFFRQLIINHKVDLINFQAVYQLIIAFISSKIFLRKKKIKLIYTMHTTRYRYTFLRKVLLCLIINLCADLAIFVSEEPIEKLIKYGLIRNKIRVVYNGISTEFFDEVIMSHKLSAPYCFLEDSSEIIISCCASLIPRKGHKYLISAVSKLSRDYKNIKLVLTSKGPLQNELINFAKKLGISDKIYFTGRVSYEDLYKILSITDVYVFPSLSEVFPYAILEAMTAKKAIVTTKVGGIPEALIHMKSGLLVPRGSSESLYNAIKILIKSPKLMKELGANARLSVEKRFNVNFIAEQLIDAYTISLMK